MLTVAQSGAVYPEAAAYAGLGRLYAMHPETAGAASHSSIELVAKAISKFQQSVALGASGALGRWVERELSDAEYWLGCLYICAKEYTKALDLFT